MASGKALFPGSTVFQELALIFRTLGFPNEQSECGYLLLDYSSDYDHLSDYSVLTE